jgi:hypothetical protein
MCEVSAYVHFSMSPNVGRLFCVRFLSTYPFEGVLDFCSTDSLDGLHMGGYHCKNSRKRHQAGKGEGVASPCQFQSMTGYSDGSTVMTKKTRKRVAR